MGEFSVWLLLILINRMLIYMAIGMVIGSMVLYPVNDGAFRQAVWRYGMLGCCLGILASGAGFFLQVGLFAEGGWSGMWNPEYISLLWDSPFGTILLLQAGAWLIVSLLLMLNRHRPAMPVVQRVLAGLAILALAAAFTLAGHTAEQSIWIRMALGLHVLVGLGWVGCLYPLWLSCSHLSVPTLQTHMRRFGSLAAGLVPLLLLAGVWIAWQLTGSVANLLGSGHGRLLLLKILAVAGILAVAAWHKFYLVERLTDAVQAARLARSIRRELVVGGLILVITLLLANLTGPVVLNSL